MPGENRFARKERAKTFCTISGDKCVLYTPGIPTQALRKMHTKENWFLFSASRCTSRSRPIGCNVPKQLQYS